MNRLVIFVACTFISIYAVAEKENFDQTFDIRQHLNTKSPYWSLASDNHQILAEQGECTPIHFNLVARHGSRQPSSGDVAKLLKLQQLLNVYWEQITNDNIRGWMENWMSPYAAALAGLLTVGGEEQHYYLAKRYRGAFDPLLSQTYESYLYPIQTTQVSRASKSGSAFGFGLFEGTGELGPSLYEPLYIYSESNDEDLTLRFFDNCPAYTEEVLNNQSYSYDKDQYIRFTAPTLIANVKDRLGLLNNSTWDLSIEDVRLFQLACTFDVAIANDTTHFCSLFNQSDFEKFEYASDIGDYYQKGYGSGIGYQISCALLQDFFEVMDSVISGSITQNAKLRFAHAETVIPFVSLLGLYKDDFEPHWNSPEADISSRRWRTSQISPFAANVGFVLLNCSGGYHVQLVHNEATVKFPNCSADPCPYEELKNIYSGVVPCDITTMCNGPPLQQVCPSLHHKSGLSTVAFVFIALGCFAIGGVTAMGGIMLYDHRRAKRRHKSYYRFSLHDSDS